MKPAASDSSPEPLFDDAPMAVDTTVVDRNAAFQTEEVLTVSSGHFFHDSYSAFISPLLPIIRDNLGTGYALTGNLTVFMQLPSVLNPFIGYLADKVSLRYFIILAPGVTGTLMSALGLAPDYLSLVFILLAAGVSIAAFHAPAPAMIGRLAGARVGRGMSVFMAAGELGRTIGPLFVAWGVDTFGIGGIWRLGIVGWLVSAVLYRRLRTISARPLGERGSVAAIWPDVRRLFPPLIWLSLTRVFVLVCLTIYLPIYMTDVREVSNIYLSASPLAVLEGAGVVGALLSGTLSDRLGRRRMLTILLSTSPLLFLAFVLAPEGLLFPLLILLGLLAISSTPVLLAIVQDHFTVNRALANGLFLTVLFLTRALATWGVGLLADWQGLEQAFLISAAIAFLALPALRFLPAGEGSYIR